MKRLERYVAKTILSTIGFVTLLLAGLQAFILFVNQLGDLGKGSYGLVQAAFFVCLQLPYQFYLFFPIASLLGCLIGLGIMANHHELVVMRAAGMSIAQVTVAVLKATMLIVIITAIMGETVVPKLTYLANDQKLQALSNGQTLRTSRGVWLRQQNDFISIGAILPNNLLADVFQFHFDETQHMRFTREIGKVEYLDGQWHAQDVAETAINKENTSTQHIHEMIWEVALKPDILKVGGSDPAEMTLHELRTYVRAQKQSHQNVLSYRLVYWQRLIQPITTAVMMMLAIPFIFGPLRSSTLGSKLLIGITVGFGFYIVNRFLGVLSQVAQWPPEIAAIGPTLFFMLLGCYLMRQVR